MRKITDKLSLKEKRNVYSRKPSNIDKYHQSIKGQCIHKKRSLEDIYKQPSRSCLHNYYDEAFFINLPERTDRLQEIQSELNRVHISANKFQAIKPSSPAFGLRIGQLGCILSHLEVIKNASKRNLNSVLIMEDDVIFIEKFNEVIPNFIKQLLEIPKWDLLYIGFRQNGPYEYKTRNIVKLQGALCTHAYIIRKSIFNLVIEEFKRDPTTIDVIYNRICPVINAIAFKPILAWQRANFSDIEGGYYNHWFLVDQTDIPHFSPRQRLENHDR